MLIKSCRRDSALRTVLFQCLRGCSASWRRARSCPRRPVSPSALPLPREDGPGGPRHEAALQHHRRRGAAGEARRALRGVLGVSGGLPARQGAVQPAPPVGRAAEAAFGSAVPAFPPRFYLTMTKSMADERWSQLEQYLQNVTLDSNVTNSDVFRGFFQKLQQDTFKIQTERTFLDVYLADGSNIRLEIQTLDTAERILEVKLCKMGLSRELIEYFSLFFFQDHDNGALSVVKKVAEFELPFVSLQSMKELHCKLGIRTWYMDPSVDTLLMDCTASLNLLYMQLLELIREMQFYGYIRIDPFICDYPEEGCSGDIFVGNNEIHCCIKLPTNQTKEVSFKINRLRSWQVAFLGATKDGEEDTLELRFEYNDSGTWQWIILYTKQAFLLSSCLKKMVSEQMIKAAKEGQEMEMKMTESMINSKKSSIQQKQAGEGAKLELMGKEEGKKHA